MFGLDPRDGAERIEIRRRLGYLPQELRYHRHFTVAAFLDYIAILKDVFDRRHRAEEVARVLALTGLEDRAGTRIRALSGGMRQRLGIAQALLGRPELLILDEPTSGLDPEQRLRFRELLSDQSMSPGTQFTEAAYRLAKAMTGLPEAKVSQPWRSPSPAWRCGTHGTATHGSGPVSRSPAQAASAAVPSGGTPE